MFTIYRITNSTNLKTYIGFTTKSVDTRWKQHKSKALCGSLSHLSCSIRKYGSSSFVLDILEEGWDPKVGKNIREPYWISVLPHDYNMTAGGEGTFGRECTTTTRRKLSALSMGNRNGLGYIHTEKTRKLLAELKTGTKQSKEQKQKHSDFMKGNSYANGRLPRV